MSSNEEEDFEGRQIQAEGDSITKQATTPLLLQDRDSIAIDRNTPHHKDENCYLINNEDQGSKCNMKGQNEYSFVGACTSSCSASNSNVTDVVRDNASCKSSSSTITCEEEDENVELQEILHEHEDKMDRLIATGEMVRSSDEDDSPDSKLLKTGNKLSSISKDAGPGFLNRGNCKDCISKTTEDFNKKGSSVECTLNQDSIDVCGSPSSDITEPELAGVNLNSQENFCSSDRKSCKDSAYSDSPSSEFEYSASSSVASCAEDSGISSTVRDDEMEEIPLADGSYSPNLFQEISKMNVDDMVSSWVPKSKNTYAPNVGRKNSGYVGNLLSDDKTDGRQQPQQSKIKERFSDSGSETDHNTAGWKLFGKVPPKESSSQSSIPFSRDDVKRRSLGEQEKSSRKPKFLSLKRNTTAVPSSTTALIFENRPRNLPAKSPSEEKKHRQQYEAMVAQARKKELQEAKKQQKEAKVKNKQEKVIVTSAAIWTNEILPNWETMKTSRRAKELWWQGIPPSVRGKVWKLAIGNDLQITHELFDIFQAHAYEKLIITRNNKKRLKQSKSVAELPTNNFIPVVNSEHKVELIMLDVSRTFPSLCIFQEGGPFHDVLHSILGAYTCYRPDVGYVQGMSFIAAVLLLNMEPPDAFVCFANLLNKPCQLVFFRVDHPMMKAYFATFEILLEEFLPKIGKLFLEENFSPDMYLIDWIFTLFSKSLPLDVACRVWDVFCRDGDDFLFRTALGILKFYQAELIGMDFIHLGQFLSKLPDDVPANKLFDCISSINLSRQKFNQILAQQKELATQIKTVTASAGK